jgi:hypothetical protein
MSVEYFMERPQVVEKIPRATRRGKANFRQQGKKEKKAKQKDHYSRDKKGPKIAPTRENGR